MKKTKKEVVETILRQAMEVFFEAGIDGYAGTKDRKSKKVVDSDGYKTITYQSGQFRVEDRYCTTPSSDYSAGTTTIFYRDKPVWWMSYGGFYKKEAIPVLKMALSKAYHAKNFFGGRGQDHNDGSRFYANSIRGFHGPDRNNFHKFSGREEITKLYDASGKVLETQKLLGYHEYFGMSFI